MTELEQLKARVEVLEEAVRRAIAWFDGIPRGELREYASDVSAALRKALEQKPEAPR